MLDLIAFVLLLIAYSSFCGLTIVNIEGDET